MFSQNYAQVNNLETISIEYLYDGLVLQDDIFNYNGTLLLIAKGNTLTANLIEQLKRFNNAEKNVKVSPRLHKKLMESGMPLKVKQNYLEDKVGYTEAKNKAKNLMKIAEITSHIPYEQVCDISALVVNQLEITEPALLFQCINGTNEVSEYLYRHSVNVAMINGLMGKWLNLDAEEINNLVIVGLVHDIGNTKVPEHVLYSPNKLTDDEFELVKNHVFHSYDILNGSNHFNELICSGVRCHHEKMNGSGYPDGLVADDIPLYARINAISDVYDAMVSKRSYKAAKSPFVVLKQLKEERFWGLDIVLVNTFTEQMPRELLGKSILMSNGMAGIVKHVRDTNIEFPIVEISGDIITTNRDLYCVSMIIDEV